jgi:hypothetical protein
LYIIENDNEDDDNDDDEDDDDDDNNISFTCWHNSLTINYKIATKAHT